MVFESELEAGAQILLNHLRSMAEELRQLPEDKWDWSFAASAPSPRTLAVHALQWLQCDGQHIQVPDTREHVLVPEAPSEPTAICDAMDAEADRWEELLKGLTEADLLRPGLQFGYEKGHMNVRGFVYHMIQNVIYKHGQFTTIFYALGLDGDEAYDAPFPNPIYREMLGIG